MSSNPVVIPGDLHVNGNLRVFGSSVSLPAGVVTNQMIATLAGIEATKMDQQHSLLWSQNGTAAAATQVLHAGYGLAGTIVKVRAGLVAASTGDATVTIDVKKDGVTVLDDPIVLDAADAAYTPVDGVVSVSALATTDVLTVVVTVDAGTGALGSGLYVQAIVHEDATPTA